MKYDIFVGIDVSKDSFCACAMDRDKDILFEGQFSMDKEGFVAFINKLSVFKKEDILTGCESSGCYHINLFSFLTEYGFNCCIINPLLISSFMKMSLRKTKTDKKDARTIALFLFMFHESISENHIISSELKDLIREREHIAQEIARVKNDMEKLLFVTFPELEKKVNINSISILGLISRFPSAFRIRKASRQDIKKAMENDRGRKVEISEKEIIELARNSVASFHPGKELILSQKASLLIFLMEKMREIEEMLKEIFEKSEFKGDIDILTSIRGVGETTAMHLLCEVGDIKRFSSCRKLIAYAGLDPEVYQSGRFEGKSKLSKRGNRHIRRVIWIMTLMVIRFNEVFRAYFTRRRDEGLPFKKAVIATAHKLIRVIYSMLIHKRYFSYEGFQNGVCEGVNS